MGTVINVLKNTNKEERTKNFTALFLKLVNERGRDCYCVVGDKIENNLQKTNRKI